MAREAGRPLSEGPLHDRTSVLEQHSMSAPINVPALMIHGRDDGCIGAELLDGMEKLFPKGLKKEVVPGAGHFVHQEKPELVNEVVLKFLKS